MTDNPARVIYRVMINPDTAPTREYVAAAEIVEDRGDGSCLLMVFPRRSEPFQIGPIIRADLRDPGSQDFRVWEPAPSDPEGV